MISGNYFILLICILLSSNVIGDEVDIECKETEVCKCYHAENKPKQVRCEGSTTVAANIDSANLKLFGQSLRGNWEVLYIYNTKLTQIEVDTFKNVKFQRIIIANNDELLTIDGGSFGDSDITHELEIRENKKLSKSGIFKVAVKLGKGLTNIWLHKNNIALTASETFVGKIGTDEVFQKLETINIDNQENGILTEIPANFISALPKLKQVSLGSNKITKIGNDAFDLKLSNPETKHVIIFLDKNKAEIDAMKITEAQIKSPTDTKISIGLFLEDTPITELKAEFVALLVSIINQNGRVYLKGSTITTCACTTAQTMITNTKAINIHGMETVKCETNKKLSECK